MKKLILLALLILVSNQALAIEDFVEEDKKSSWYDWYNPEKDKIVVIDGKRCISRFTEGLTKPVCNRDVMAVLNKFKHALIDDDFDALAKLLKFPLNWGNYSRSHHSNFRNIEQLKNIYPYKKMFSSSFKTVVLLTTLDDVYIRENRGEIELIEELVYLDRELRIDTLTFIYPAWFKGKVESKIEEIMSHDRKMDLKISKENKKKH